MATPQPTVLCTDGCCLNNGHPDALATSAVWFGDGDPRNMVEPLQGEAQTNQRAELRALVMALEWIVQDLEQELRHDPGHGPGQDLGHVEAAGDYVVRTDSLYSINCMTKWVAGWKRNGWQTSKRKPVLHRDLIQQLDGLMLRVGPRVSLVHVRGHSGDYGNEQADALCQGLAREMRAAAAE